MAFRSLYSRDRRAEESRNNSVSGYSYGKTTQVISITDLISEGPIQGLVEGARSVYLNNDPIFEEQETFQLGGFTTRLTNTGGGDTFTVVGNPNFNYTMVQNNFGPSRNLLKILDLYNLEVSLSNPVYPSPLGGGTQFTLNWDYSNSGVQLPTFSEITENIAQPLSTGVSLPMTIALGKDITRNYIARVITIPNNTSKSVNVVITAIGGDSALEPFTSGLHTANIGLNLSLSATNGTTLVTKVNPGVTIPASQAKEFLINRPVAGLTSTKYRGSGVQFNTGTINQPMIITPLGVGSTTKQLSTAGVSNLNLAEEGTITATAAEQAAEIDKVQLEFRYPGGLIMHKTESGAKYAAGAGYSIQIRLDTSNGDGTSYGDYIDVEGNFTPVPDAVRDLNQSSGVNISQGDSLFAHGGKFVTAASFYHTIDLQQYQPFVGFQIKIKRVTNSEDLTDNQAGRAHVWDLGRSDGRPRLGWRGTDIDKWQAVQGGGIQTALGVITEKVNYPLTSIANVTFDAEAFDSTPSRTYDAYGLKVLVPSNYTPREKKLPQLDTGFYDVDDLYEGIWDGTFVTEKIYTDNPAWIFYDILTNNRYGVGQYVRADDIDKWSLYKIARYCDELVPDGKGGLEPRFRANIYLQKATDVYKVLKDMATIFRGIIYWGDGKLFPVIDDKKHPVYTFNKSNVLDGVFNYESTASKTRTNQMIVQWNNPEADYKLEPIIVEDRQNIVETGQVNQEEATAFGCTSEGQAIRYGRWKLWTAINQTELVEFKTAYNAAFLAPGDIINVQDNHEYNLQFSGRVSSATTNSLTIDREVDESSSSGQVFVVIPESKVVLSQTSASVNNTTISAGEEVTQAHDEDGTLYTFSFATSESAYAQINNAYDENGNLLTLQYNEATSVLTADISSISSRELTLPANSFTSGQVSKMEGAVYGVRDRNASAASVKEFKIVAITKEDDNTYGITAVEYYESKFDNVDYNFSLAQQDPLAPTPQPQDTIPKPENVRATKNSDGDQPSEEIILSWERPESTNLDLYFRVEHNVVGYPNPIVTAENQVIFSNITEGGYYHFTVRSQDERGRKSAAVTRTIYLSEEILESPQDRLFGLKLGGYADARAVIDTSNEVVKFEANTTIFAPSTGTSGERYEFTSASVNYAVLGASEVAYVLADTSGSTLTLIKHLEDTPRGVAYWYDKNIGTDSNRWTQVSASSIYVQSTTERESYIETDSLTEDYNNLINYTNVLRYSTTTMSAAALVSTIENEGKEVYIDRDINASGLNPVLFKDQLSPDFAKDFIIGSIDGSGNWKSYLTIDPDLQPAKAVNIALTPATINYNASSTQVNTPSNFVATVTALGFRDPEFRITLDGFNGSPDAGFVAANGSNPYIYTFTTTDGAVTYGSGSSALITASIREAGNVAEEFSTVFEAAKIREGATGNDGRTVSISASNTIFTYTADGISPSPTTQEFEAIAFGTTGTEYFEFIVDGASQGINQSSTFSYTPSASADQMPQTIQVKLYEGGSAGAAVASDFTSAIAILPGAAGTPGTPGGPGDPGADAYTLVLPNPTHSFTASKTGVVQSYSSSGTTIQVYKGTTLLTYNTSNDTTGTFRVSTATDGNISVGSITGNGTTTATVDDHSAYTTNANSATITYTISADNAVTITALQTFSLSKKGEDGQSITGDPGLRYAEGYVYYQSASSSAPATPTGLQWKFDTVSFSAGAGGTLSSQGWDQQPPNNVGQDGQFWISRWYAEETASESGEGNPVFETSRSSTNFTNVVVFSDLTSGGSTVIDGARISTGEITLGADVNSLGAIKAGKTSDSDTSQGFYLGFDDAASNSTRALFHIGDDTESLRWTGSSLEVKGTLAGDTIEVNDSGTLILGNSASVAGDLQATTVAPGGVNVASLGQDVINLIDSRVGTTVGSTFAGYYARNNPTTRYSSGATTQAFEMSFDSAGGSVASVTRGPGDITLKLSINHFWSLGVGNFSLANRQASAQFQYRTDPSGSWVNAANSISFTVQEDFLDLFGETLYLYNAVVDNEQTFTGLSEGTAYDWRVVFTSTGTASPINQTGGAFLFEASVLEGASGATATGGSSSTAAFATNAGQLGGVAAANYLRSDVDDNAAGEITFANNHGVLFASSSAGGAASRLYRAGGNATRFSYYENAFVFDSEDNTPFELRNSFDAYNFKITPNTTASSATLDFTGNVIRYPNAQNTTAETNVVTFNTSSGLLGYRELGSNAFNSTSYLPTAGGTVTGNLIVSGDLDVNGTTTTIDSSVVSVSAKTITVARNATTSSQADGAGLFVEGADASILYSNSGTKWVLNRNTVVEGVLTVGSGGTSIINLDDSTDDDDHAIRFRDTRSSDNVTTAFEITTANDDLNLVARSGATRHIMLTACSGNVGINLQGRDPTHDLTVGGTTWLVSENRSGSSESPVLRLGNLTSNSSTSLYNIYTNDDVADQLEINTARYGSLISFTRGSEGGGRVKGFEAIAVTKTGTPTERGTELRLYSQTDVSSTATTQRVKMSAVSGCASYITSGNFGIGTTSPGTTLQLGDGTVDSTLRAYYSDASYVDLKGFGLEFNRSTSYLRPTTNGTAGLVIGGTSLSADNASNDWNSVEFRTNNVFFRKGQVTVDKQNLTIKTESSNTAGLLIFDNVDGTYNWWNYQASDNKLNWVVTSTGGAEMSLTANGTTHSSAQLIIGGGVDVGGTITAYDTYTNVVNARGGSFASGIDTTTAAGLVLKKGFKISSDDGNYLRDIIQHGTNNNITIGQGGTSLIGNIELYPGTSGTVNFRTRCSSQIVSQVLPTGTKTNGTVQDIVGDDAGLHNTKFNWLKSNTGSSGANVWYKVADISIANQAFSAIAMKIVYSTGENNYGDHDFINKHYSVATFVRNNSLTLNNSPDTATLRGTGSDVRAYKTGVGTYELQARGTLANQKFAVEVTIYQSNGGTITPTLDGSTVGATTGGTEFTIQAPVDSSAKDGIREYFGNIYPANMTTTGSVGIGTTLPNTSRLHIKGSTGVDSAVRAEATGTNSEAYYIADNDASVWTWGISNDDSWKLSNAFGLGSSKLTVTTGGRVGINTTLPGGLGDYSLSSADALFHVKGPGTTGQRNIVARFEAGTDADNTAAGIIINHSNDRGIAITAGRGTSDETLVNFSMISSGGTVQDAMTFRRSAVSVASSVGINEDTNLSAGLTVRGGNYANNQNSGLVLQSGDAGSSHWRAGLKIKSTSGGVPRVALDVMKGTSGSVLEAVVFERDTGFVGIGTTDPDKALVVSGSGAEAEIVINDSVGTPTLRFRSAGITIGSINSSDTTGALTFISRSSGIHFDDTTFRPFNADSGTLSLGDFNNRWGGLYTSGAINFGPEGSPTQTYIQYTRSSGGAVQTITLMQRHTELGAVSFGGDDGVIIGAGETRAQIVNNLPSLASEQLHLGAEGPIYLYTSPDNWSSGWSARNELKFDNFGNLTVTPSNGSAQNFLTTATLETVGATPFTQDTPGESLIKYSASSNVIFHEDLNTNAVTGSSLLASPVAGGATMGDGIINSQSSKFRMVGDISHVLGHVTGVTILELDFGNSKLEVSGSASNVGSIDIRADSITANEISASTITGTEISATTQILVGVGTNIAGLAGDGTDDNSLVRIFAGSDYANRATAPFRVTQGGALTATNATITGDVTANTGTIGGFSITNSSLYAGTGTYANSNTPVYLSKSAGTAKGNFSLGDKLTWDGTSLSIEGAINATSGSFTGNVTMNSGTIANSVTIGGTAASTIESGAAAGATASQVSRGIAFLSNVNLAGTANNGEGALVGTDENGEPDLTKNGFIVYEGTKYTIPRNQFGTTATGFSILTNLANKKGFIAYDINETKSFTYSSSSFDVAFVFKEGNQWYYDPNGNAVPFTPSGSGREMVAIGYLETTTADLIAGAGLFDPVALETAAFPGDDQQSGTVGGWTIDAEAMYSGTKVTSDSGYSTAGITLRSAGSLHSQNFYIDTDGNALFRGELSAASGTFSGSLTAQSISAGNIVAGTITATEIAASTITATEIATGTITATQLAANSITASELQANSISAGNIIAGTITATEIATGVITATELAANSITASELQANSISAGNIIAGTITASRIASNSISAGNLAANSITASELQANSISAGNIIAGTITATELAANTITATELLVTNATSSIVPDPTFVDRNAWNGNTNSFSVSSDFAGRRGIEITGDNRTFYNSQRVPITGDANYRMSVYARSALGVGKAYLLVRFTNNAGTVINGGSGWSSGTFNYWGLVNQFIPTSYTEYTFDFGPKEAVPIPSGATFMQVGILCNRTNGGTTGDTTYLSDYNVFEKTDQTRISPSSITTAAIQANAITANEIAASTITASEIQAGTITASRIAANSISAGNLAANSITASELTANSISAGNIIAGTITASRIASNSISAGNLAANSITASELQANSISAGNIIAGTITATELAANSVAASELQISNNSSGSTGVFISASAIEIYDDQATPKLRVKIGKLT